MRLRLLAVGTRMPQWIKTGYAEYARRMPPSCRLELIEIAPGKHQRGAARAMAEEERRLLEQIGRRDAVIALDGGGRAWSTEQLAARLHDWLADGRDRSLLIGGADGLSGACLARAEQRWSLSALTLPHPLVRVIVAEQLYRAVSLLNNHPYHRG
ncbi:MAG TPA: 23S rRNA (pseudouridine(1915)-N(3))-methyltransferase RlmH [Salinisphaeraceae bacterium]|nr:23S rRNA (pseudouridine(1915)-N(3))-methyltransferase RlmH [Salinisphaeraceae bacterium]